MDHAILVSSGRAARAALYSSRWEAKTRLMSSTCDEKIWWRGEGWSQGGYAVFWNDGGDQGECFVGE